MLRNRKQPFLNSSSTLHVFQFKINCHAETKYDSSTLTMTASHDSPFSCWFTAGKVQTTRWSTDSPAAKQWGQGYKQKFQGNIINSELRNCETVMQRFGSLCSRTFFVYLFIRFAHIGYDPFIAIRYKFKLSTYVQEPLVIGRCTERDLNEETAADNGHKESSK
jgi:hypothetical protein